MEFKRGGFVGLSIFEIIFFLETRKSEQNSSPALILTSLFAICLMETPKLYGDAILNHWSTSLTVTPQVQKEIHYIN